MNEIRDRQIIESIEKIKNLKEFAQKAPSNSGFVDSFREGLMDLLKKVWDKIIDIIKWIWEFLGLNKALSNLASALSNGSNAVFIVILTLVIIVALFFLLFFILRKNFKASADIKMDMDDYELLVSLRDPESLYMMAMEEAGKNNFNFSVRYLYISFILYLNKKQYVKIDKAKTNRQYLNESMQNGFLQNGKAFDITMSYNKYWYGKKHIDEGIFLSVISDYNILTEGSINEKN